MALSYKTKKHHTKGIVLLCGRIEPTPVEHPMKKCDKSLWQKELWDFFQDEIFEKNVKSSAKTALKWCFFEILSYLLRI